MRHAVSRLLIVLFAMMMVISSSLLVAQDEPTITITPDTGLVGSGIFEINVSGLVPGNLYTVEFVFDGVVVSASEEEADDAGMVAFTAASTPDDAVGIYTIQVVSNDRIVAATELVLTNETGTDAPPITSTPTTPSTVDEIGNLSISPVSGPISTLHTIRVRDLTPNTEYTVEITATETNAVVYRRIWTSDDNGEFDVEVFAEEGDTTGQQVVRVFSNDGSVVAQDSFTIDPPVERNPVVEVTPQVAQAGREITVTINGLASFDRVNVQITSESNRLIDTISARASSAGVAILSYLSSDELEDGTYSISVFVDDERMAQSTFSIGDTSTAETTESDDSSDTTTDDSSNVALTVEPEIGPIGSTHAMTVTGLESSQAITFAILDRDGNIEYSTARTADANGNFSINISSSDGDELGSYTVEISDATSGEVLVEGRMVITATESPAQTDETTEDNPTAQTGTPAINVNPPSGEIGATHTITLSGMPEGERVGVTIRAQSDNTLAQSSVVAIDESGNGTLEFTSRELNIPGVYNVIAVQPDGELASTTLTIEGAIASIEPQSGVIGTTHVITVTGLNPNEMITFDVFFGGESVYMTDTSADANGVASLRLATEDGDETGDYTIVVEREAGNEPQVILTATTAEADTTEDADSETESTPTETTVSADAQVFEETLPSSGTATLSFSGEEGEYVIIEVQSTEFDPAVAVYNDSYLEIGYNDDSNNSTDSMVGPLLLPYSGSYSLEVYSALYDETAVGGAFTVTITPVRVQTITYNEPIPFTFDETTSAIYYRLNVEAGDSLNITADTGGTLDTVMRVLYQDGYEFAYDDDGGFGFEAELTNLIFDYADTYILSISTFAEGISGEGVLTVTRNPVKSLDEGTVTVTLNDKIYRDLVVFNAEAGQLITLNLEKLYGSVEDLYIYAYVDGMEVMSYSTMGVPDTLPLIFVMPMDGQVVVSLEEFGLTSGIAFDVSVTKE